MLSLAEKIKIKIPLRVFLFFMTRQKTALISVYDKTDIETFAKSLIDLGWKIISSGGKIGRASCRERV